MMNREYIHVERMFVKNFKFRTINFFTPVCMDIIEKDTDKNLKIDNIFFPLVFFFFFFVNRNPEEKKVLTDVSLTSVP